MKNLKLSKAELLGAAAGAAYGFYSKRGILGTIGFALLGGIAGHIISPKISPESKEKVKETLKANATKAVDMAAPIMKDIEGHLS